MIKNPLAVAFGVAMKEIKLEYMFNNNIEKVDDAERELCAHTYISQPTLRQMQSGLNIPSIDTAQRLCASNVYRFTFSRMIGFSSLMNILGKKLESIDEFNLAIAKHSKTIKTDTLLHEVMKKFTMELDQPPYDENKFISNYVVKQDLPKLLVEYLRNEDSSSLIPTVQSRVDCQYDENLPNYRLKWTIFIPFFLPSVSDNVLRQGHLADFKYNSNDEYSTFTQEATFGFSFLKLFKFSGGICSWVAQLDLNISQLTEFSYFREELYKDILNGNHPLSDFTESLKEAYSHLLGTNVGYALSFVIGDDSLHQTQAVSNALKILSCPSLLTEQCSIDELDLEKNDKEINATNTAMEMQYLSEGVEHVQYEAFSFNKSLYGYASWSGVSMMVDNANYGQSVSKLIEFEAKLQALWWYLYYSKKLMDSEHRNDVYKHYNQFSIKRLIDETLDIGATETSLMRSFKEAIINTSRISEVHKAFRETLRESQYA